MSWSDVQPLLLSLAPYLVPVVLAYVTILARKAFEAMPSNQREFVRSIVSTAVNAVEQQTKLGDFSPAQKQALALRFIHDALDHFHVSVPDSVLSPMLEEAVLVLNMAQGKDNQAQPTTKAGCN